MSNLFATLDMAGQALGVYQQALNTVSNNITNANTPGYASQSLNLVAQPYELFGGLAGGVAAQGLQSARDQYGEQAVRSQSSTLGKFQAQAETTGTIASYFDPSGNSGVPLELNQLLSSFSAWSVSPNDPTTQQQVLANASNFATGVQSLSAALSQADQNVQTQIGNTVQQINGLAAQIQQINVNQQQEQSPDPGLDAQMNSTLQQLSQLVNFSEIKQSDGTVSIVLSGGAPLVIGNQQYSISAAAAIPAGSTNTKAPPTSEILDSNGNNITAQITGGQLGGLLDTHNRVLASILGDGTQAGSLNIFAKNFADTVNNILTSGTVSVTAGAAKGLPLFTYNSSDPTLAAGSLAVNPSITAATLAPVDSSGNSNGNALQLASLANSTTSGGIGGQTFLQYFAGTAQFVGSENATATTNQQSQQQIVTQAETLRDQISGVSLDAQAVQMTQFQNSYQAVAKLITVLNTVTQTTINMIQ